MHFHKCLFYDLEHPGIFRVPTWILRYTGTELVTTQHLRLIRKTWKESVIFDGSTGVTLQKEHTCLAQRLFPHHSDQCVWLLSGDNKSSFVIQLTVNVPGITWVDSRLAPSILCRFTSKCNQNSPETRHMSHTNN